MNIERTEFIAWMERIMERFDLLKERVLSSKSRFIEIDGEHLLDNQNVLQVSENQFEVAATLPD